MRITVPLITMFGASNELPDEDELTALYDRFLIRFVVDYIGEDFRFLKMLEARREPGAGNRTGLAIAELAELRAAAAAVALPGAVLRAIPEIRRELARAEIIASDRRWKSALDVLRAHAMILGRDRVIEDDLLFLEHLLWKDPEERPKVREGLHRLIKGYEEEARELLIQGQELREYAGRGWESAELKSRALIEVHSKLANILLKFEGLIRDAGESGRQTAAVESMRAQVKQIQQSLLRES
jgi:MoxR-like ATPase